MLVLFSIAIFFLLTIRLHHRRQAVFFIILWSISYVSYFLSLVENANLDFNLTYGSDAFYYYKEIVASVGTYKFKNSLAPFHVCINSFNLLLSGFETHALVVILSINVYMIIHTYLYFYYYKYINEISKGYLFFYALIAFNMIALLFVLRGMKEIWLLLAYLFAFLSILEIENRKFIKSAFYIFVSILMAKYLKPLGEIFIIIPFAIYWILFLRNKYKILLIIIALLLVLFIFDSLVMSYWKVSGDHAALNDASGVFTIRSFFRFLLGPGPYYSLSQLIYSDRFIAYTKFGDLLIFLGSVQWYFFILLAFFSILLKFKKFMTYIRSPLLFFLLAGIFYIIAYTISYDGTGDTRHRGVAYFLIISSLSPFVYKSIFIKNKSSSVFDLSSCKK